MVPAHHHQRRRSIEATGVKLRTDHVGAAAPVQVAAHVCVPRHVAVAGHLHQEGRRDWRRPVEPASEAVSVSILMKERVVGDLRVGGWRAVAREVSVTRPGDLFAAFRIRPAGVAGVRAACGHPARVVFALPHPRPGATAGLSVHAASAAALALGKGLATRGSPGPTADLEGKPGRRVPVSGLPCFAATCGAGREDRRLHRCRSGPRGPVVVPKWIAIVSITPVTRLAGLDGEVCAVGFSESRFVKTKEGAALTVSPAHLGVQAQHKGRAVAPQRRTVVRVVAGRSVVDAGGDAALRAQADGAPDDRRRGHVLRRPDQRARDLKILGRVCGQRPDLDNVVWSAGCAGPAEGLARAELRVVREQRRVVRSVDIPARPK